MKENNKILLRSRSHYKGDGEIYGEIYGKFWGAIRRQAEERNIPFKISIEDAWKLFLTQNRTCAITGVPISFSSKSQLSDGTASLDRINSDKDYSIENVQWVHKKINELKWDNTPQELIELCNKVVAHSSRQLFFDVPLEDLQFISTELKEDNFAFEGKTILLCGAFGFLGKLFQSYFLYLNENILRTSCRVICVDNYIIGKQYSNLKIPNFEYINHNICLPFSPDTLPQNIDFVINCCGIASPIFYQKFPYETLEVSYKGTREILKIAEEKKTSSSLFFSSSEVYGNPPENEIPTDEEYIGAIQTMGQRSCYDVGKLCLETLCYISHSKYGSNIKIVRPFNVFGYIPKSDGRVIPNFVSNILENKKIKIYGDGKQTRTFCWFSDFIVGAIKVLLHGDNKPYNIGNQNNEIEMVALAKLIEKICNKKDMVELMPSPPVYQEEPRRRCPNIDKAEQDLGYNPKISLEEGISKFYNWAKNKYKI
jgi:UDP-glucuronate decarboxylase